MKESTQEQVKELWEWCGFEERHNPGSYMDVTIAETVWFDPKGSKCGILPPIDLNNLFRWAVPKLQKDGWLISLRGHEFKGYDALLEYVPKDLSLVRADNDDPALALFWAIWEVIKNES